MTSTTTYSHPDQGAVDSSAAAQELLRPYRSPALQLPNRIVMAPMTRGRADADGVPHPLTAAYYAQRTGAGLIVSEGVWPAAVAAGMGTPGLVTAAQVERWRSVTTAVHAAGGRIFAQLWHVGRVTHPRVLTDGLWPLAPSAVIAEGRIHIPGGTIEHVEPRAMTAADIADTIAAYAEAARNAMLAGFDGVEVHGANGYLPHQFLGTNTNVRADAYADGRRFVIEVVDAVVDAIGADRVGIRLSPGNPENTVHEADPAAVYRSLVSTLDNRGLAYLHLSEKGEYPAISDLRSHWSGTLIGNYDPPEPTSPEIGESLLRAGTVDLMAFGRLFLANPDLPLRLATGTPLDHAPENTHYATGLVGYADYPSIDLETAFKRSA